MDKQHLGPIGPPQLYKKEQLGAHSARAKDAAGEVQHVAAVAGQCRQYVKYEAGNKDDQAPTQALGEY